MKKVVLLLLIFFISIHCFAEDLSSTGFFSKAMGYYDNGNYENALEWFQKDEEELLENEEDNQLEIATTYKFIGNCYFNLGQFEKDIEYQEKSLQIRIKLLGEDNLDVANNYNNIGNAYYWLQKYENALDYYSKAVPLQKKYRQKDDSLLIKAINQLAYTYFDLGKYEESVEYYNEALVLTVDKWGEESDAAFMLYNKIGAGYMFIGKYYAAINLIEKALELEKFYNGDNSEYSFNCNSVLSFAYRQMGDMRKSEQYFIKAITIQKALQKDNPDLVFITTSEFGDFYQSIGKYTDAINYYYEALEKNEKVNGNGNLVEFEIIKCYQRIGNYQKALELEKELLEKYSYENTEKDLLDIYDLMFDTYKSLEDYDSALLCCDEILRLGKESNKKKCWAYYRYGELYFESNDMINAKINADKCISFIDSGVESEKNLKILIYRLMIEILEKNKDYENCKYYFDKLDYLCFDDTDWVYKSLFCQLKFSYYDLLENYEEAEKYLLYMVEGESDLGLDYTYGLYLLCACFYRDKLKDYDKYEFYINKYFDEARRSEQYLNLIELSWSVLTDYNFDRQKEKKTILRFVQTGTDAAERAINLLSGDKQAILRKALPLYYAGVDLTAKDKEYDKAFEYSEKLRSRGFLEEVGTDAALKLPELTAEEISTLKNYMEKIPLYAKNLELEKSKSVAERNGNLVKELETELSKKLKELDALEKEIGNRIPKYTQLRNPSTVSAKDARKWCGKNRVILEYVMWNPDYASVMQEKGLNTSESLSKLSDSEQVPEIGSYCLVITNKKITAVKLDGEYDYDETIKKLREFIMKGRSLSESSVNIRRMELYEKLIAPVEKYIPSGTKDIVIVPDGNLSSLPFEILGDDKGKDFGEKYNLSFSPSVSVSMLKQKNQKMETRFLGFGNPVYNTDGTSKNRGLNDLPDVEPASGKLYANAGEYYAERKFKWANLPGTGMELNTLKDNVFTESSSQIIESMESTEKHLKRLSQEGKLSEYTNLHFACHGYFNETDSNMSSIVLSEVSGSITDSEEDGYLTLPEIATLNISCDFLNLSACQTGLSHQKRGDGMSGLTRSCIVAGADEVGATLWEVSDEATCQFMVSMYSKVKKGMTYKEAYRKTKSEFRKCDYSEPVFWAAFVIWE